MTLLLDAWATTMWKSCWQGSIVVLVVWMICRLLPTMPARYQCWFWRLAILKFGVVLLLPTLISLPLLPAPSVAIHELPVQEVGVQAATAEMPVVDTVPPIPTDSAPITPSKTWELPSLRALLCFAWILGATWCLVWLLVAWYAALRLRYRSRMIDNVPLLDQLATQGRLFRLRHLPRLITVEGSGSPMLIGFLRPTIVIPTETLGRLSISEQTMVLGHELAHIRRRDLLWSFVASLVRAVFFFHPLVWWSERQLKLAQEVAADELAIARQHHDPVGYGELLVSVVSKLGHRPSIPTVSVATAGTVRSLARRLVAMTCIARASRRVVIGSGILLGAVVVLGLVPWRLVAAEPKQDRTPPSVGEMKHTSSGKDQQPRDEKALPFETLMVNPVIPVPTPHTKTTSLQPELKRLVEEKSKELRQLVGKTFEGLIQVTHVNQKDGHVVVTGMSVVFRGVAVIRGYYEFQFLIDVPELKNKAANLKGHFVKVRAKLQETPMLYADGRGSAKFSGVAFLEPFPPPIPQSNEERKQQEAVATIEKLGGKVTVDENSPEKSDFRLYGEKQSSAPTVEQRPNTAKQQVVVISVANDGTLAVAGQQCQPSELAAKLRDLTAKRTIAVKVQANATIPYTRLSAVINACQTAGVKQVSLATTK